MYIITGGAGFLGSALLWGLNRHGIKDVLVVDNLACTEKWKNLVGCDYLAYMHRDDFLRVLRDDKLEESLETGFGPGVGNTKLEGVVHLGACSATTERDAEFLMRNNLEYSKILCDYTLKRGGRFIQASSAATYGDGENGFEDDENSLEKLRPLNMYGYSKHLFDLWAKRTGRLKHIAALKFFNVYGPNEYHKGDMRSVPHKAAGQIEASGRVGLFRSYRAEYADGGQMRDFIYVKDCVEIMIWLLGHKEANGIFNVGAGEARSWNDLAAAVFAAMGRETNIEYIEMPETLKEKYQYYTKADIGRLRAAGCVGPGSGQVKMTSLEAGVADYVRNYLLDGEKYLTQVK